MNDYWDNTLTAFTDASAKVESEFDKHRRHYEELLSEQDQGLTERLTKIIEKLEQQKSFFDSIPWKDQ